MKLRMAAAVLTLATLPGCMTMGGSGDGDPGGTINRQLRAATELARGQGYGVAVQQPATGRLNGGTQEEVGLTLNAGRQYLMIGVCDGDCTDMDLQLYSSSGQKLAEDVANDDTPVLQFTANASGQHRIRVIMAQCSANPCYYGVALYAK